MQFKLRAAHDCYCDEPKFVYNKVHQAFPVFVECDNAGGEPYYTFSITINSMEELKTLSEICDHERIIVSFERMEITIYDDYME